MRIVHAAHYSLTRDGTEFFNCEFKFHTGLCQAGHYVYPFSINDRARANIFGSKNFGKGFANKCLLDCCRNVEPDLLLLGHAQYIKPETLAMLRQSYPLMKIALWYVDPVYPPHDYEHLFQKLSCLDALFVTTGGEHLDQFRKTTCRVAFIPNPADSNLERLNLDEEHSKKEYDLVYIGSDKNRPQRRAFLEELARKSNGLRLGFAACMDQPPVWGQAKDRLLRKSLMALNLSDRNDIALYSSDRLVQLTGNGLCTFSDAASGLQALYEPDREMVFFDSLDDLIVKAKRLAQRPEKACAIGRAGRIKTHQYYSGKAIGDFMCKFTFNGTLAGFAWPQ
ncbi:MAG: glycosyltransferase [Kiritimatiellales bacterium]